jgi:hypothetical protein
VSNGDKVRALWLAQHEFRTDDVLALVHPEVQWSPMSRPARSIYEGHDGVRLMFDDARRANGLYWTELDEVTEPEDGVVWAKSRVITPTDEGTTEIHLHLVITFLDGLIHRVDTTRLDAP